MFGMPAIDATDRHPTVQDLASWFDYDHLPPPLRGISQHFAVLAEDMLDRLPDGPQVALGLQKLLEAKDCFVRAAKRADDEAAQQFAIEQADHLQEIRKAAIRDLDARLARVSPENPLGVDTGRDDTVGQEHS
jgi:hypothetical protein